jgi:hypothetical protein
MTFTDPAAVFDFDPNDIPAADDRDEWDEEREPTEEPAELYHTDDPGITQYEEWPSLHDRDGVEYLQPPLLGDA